MPARLNDPVYRHRTVQILVDAALPGVQLVETMDDAAKRAAELAAGV